MSHNDDSVLPQCRGVIEHTVYLKLQINTYYSDLPGENYLSVEVARQPTGNH